MEERYTTAWRKLAIAVYKQPVDSRIYGIFDADVTDIVDYIEKERKKGRRLTITHFVTAAVARTLYEDAPDVNCFVRRGHVVFRDNADVFVTVSIKGKDMTGLIVRNAQDLGVGEISEIIRKKAEQKRSGEESGAFASKGILSKIPWPFRRMLFVLIKFWIFDLGFAFPFLKIPADPFGSIMVTNIGSFGLSYGMVALFPIGKIPAVITMGKIEDKPVVINGEIKIRKMLPLTGTFDHRIVDGAQAGVLNQGLISRLKDPKKLDSPNPHETESE
ncbi:2-oxo acid dehydrogenase subunit E2 [bacterium]|nr:2-oxo acid dehydrogenase subunit E2 [bacterium]MBU1633315.1 2-oxo acid dehydrogenase subunit E2 [bacterium]MBU1875236.1 2-oxo acid dehydrogenase subunit E2 [bacterium]